MHRRTCKLCCHNEVCDGKSLCSDYAPLGEVAEDMEVERMIAEIKERTRQEWAAYKAGFFE